MGAWGPGPLDILVGRNTASRVGMVGLVLTPQEKPKGFGQVSQAPFHGTVLWIGQKTALLAQFRGTTRSPLTHCTEAEAENMFAQWPQPNQM